MGLSCVVRVWKGGRIGSLEGRNGLLRGHELELYDVVTLEAILFRILIIFKSTKSCSNAVTDTLIYSPRPRCSMCPYWIKRNVRGRRPSLSALMC